jgi:acetyl esterase
MSEIYQHPNNRRRAMDPELAALRVLIPHIDFTDVQHARALEHEVSIEMRSGAPRTDVEIADTSCTRPDGSHIGLRVYRPSQPARRANPVLLFFHGGSFITGGLETEEARCEEYAADAECVVIAVDYRLAPEHPYPAAFDDCYSAVEWAVAHAQNLGIDDRQVAVGGLSAGGALAAGVAARARDAGGPRITFQMLLFPVLDALMSTYSVSAFTDTPILTRDLVASMWNLYLGDVESARANVYASPAALSELTGLPPAFIATAEFDPLRDEALLFAQRLLHSDVSVELHHYARAYHSFDSLRAARLAATARRAQVDALRVAFS